MTCGLVFKDPSQCSRSLVLKKKGSRCPAFDAACHVAQATQAYLEGDKALAKKLGASGRWHAAQMAKAHQLASEDIFRQRNPSPQGKHFQLTVPMSFSEQLP